MASVAVPEDYSDVMGQDLSLEDYTEDGLDLQTMLNGQGQVVNIQVENSSQKWMLRASVLEKRALPYQRLRTDCGAPFVHKQNDSTWKVDEIIRYSDGFPLPSNTDELNAFDSEIFADNVRTVDIQLKSKPQRTKSIPNLGVLKSRLTRLQIPSPSKPKFLDRLFSNVGLSKKSHGKLRNGLIISTSEITTDLTEEDIAQTVSQSLIASDVDEVFSDPEPDISPEAEFTQTINTAWSTPNSPKVTGIVKQRLLDFQKLSQECRCRSMSTPSSPQAARKIYTQRSTRLRHQFKEDNPVSFNCSGFSRNENFRKQVMQKGYVKALVEQIDKKDGSDSDGGEVAPQQTETKTETKNAKTEEVILEIPNVKPSSVAKKEKEKQSPKPAAKFGHRELRVSTSSQSSGKPWQSQGGSEPLQHQDSVRSELSEVSVMEDSVVSEYTSDPVIYGNVNVTSGYSISENSDQAIYSNSSVPLSNRTSNGQPTDAESGIASETSTMGLNAAELFDSSWSDSDNSFETYHSDYDSDNKEDECEKLESGVQECKLKKICNELLHTERAYVKRLHLLDEVFKQKITEENEKEKIFAADIPNQMFSNITSIHQFHRDFLLPQLEKRMENWENESKIGDLMKTNAPFLKMNSEYVKNFDHSMELINTWMDKSSKFANVIKMIQATPECCCLTLQHHMLEPIQRVPRYEMLLKDYIKHLSEDSQDMQDAKIALEKVTQAAKHSNEAMKKIEKFQKLLQIKEKLDTRIDLISPTRELVQEGKVKKISARGRERQDRYLFLFNDLLLVCCEPLLGQGSYKVKAELEMDGLEIVEGENMDIPNTFYVKSRQKIIQLLDETPSGEPGMWCDTIKEVIKEFRRRKQSLGGDLLPETHTEMSKAELGTVAPRWIKDDEVTMCMSCASHFTKLRRRHHCRACGMVICGKCSSKRVPLAYDNNQLNRVCDKCYPILKHEAKDSIKEKNSVKARKILQKKANEPSVLSGYLQRSMDRGKTWCKRWFVVSKEFALYEFKAHQDIIALSTLPLPGYSVNKDIENMEFVFSLCHPQKRDEVILFKADNSDSKDRWADVMSKVAQLQLPDENSSNRHSTQSSSSNNSGGENTTSCDVHSPEAPDAQL